jgi:HD-like signal output (HDOD) protein
MTPDPTFITRAPPGVEGWVEALGQRDIPVFETTLAAIADAQAHEEACDAHNLAELIEDDPLMTLKLLRHVAQQRRGSATDIETVTGALVMMGITPFFREFGQQRAVQARLADWPEALEGLAAVRERAHRAAHFALGFAIHRMDHDAALIHEAALLHDFAEMLLWVHAPVLALEIARRQRGDRQLRSTAAQRDVLGVTLTDLQQALMRSWRLPDMLVRITDDRVSACPQVRNVQLAIRVSRHSGSGWDNPALPDDVDEIATLLNLGTVPTLQLLRELSDATG